MTGPALVLPAAFALILGVVLVVVGLQRREDAHAGEQITRVRGLGERWRSTSRRWRVAFVASVVAGLVAFALTGLAVMLVAVPAALLGLPWLLGTPANRELDILQALDQWVRLVTSSLLTGKSVPDAIRATRRQAPERLASSVHLAVSRMDGRWSTSDALRAMADELESADADAVLAAMMLASQRGGTGASDTLHGLAESTQDRLRALREVEAERAKPRIVVRQVTLITITVLALALVVGRQFFAPYGTPLGQVILALLLAAYVGSLVVLRRRTQPRARARILTGSTT